MLILLLVLKKKINAFDYFIIEMTTYCIRNIHIVLYIQLHTLSVFKYLHCANNVVVIPSKCTLVYNKDIWLFVGTLPHTMYSSIYNRNIIKRVGVTIICEN